MPTLPKAFPHVASYPAFQSVNISAIFGQVEVSPPSLPKGAPAVSELVTAQALAAPPLFPNLLLESFHTLGVCHSTEESFTAVAPHDGIAPPQSLGFAGA